MLAGVVTDFSAERGLGTIESVDGDSFLFHVIEIADGTRDIDVGRAVTFDRLPRFGRLQAARILKV